MHKLHLLPLLALLALSGCRTNPACERQIGLMRSELIALEDKYYLLESKYRDAIGSNGTTSEVCDPMGQPILTPNRPEILNPSRPSDSDLKIQIDPNDSSDSIAPQAAPIASELDNQAAQSVVEFQTPMRFAKNRDPGRDSASNEAEGSVVAFTEGDPTFNVGVTLEEQARAGDASRRPEVSNGDGQSIIQVPPLVDPLRLSGRGDDATPGDDGLSLVVQVPDSRWSAEGVLTISVIDPNETAEQQRIGLWRLSPEEIQHVVERTTNSSTIEIPLELSWNQSVPKHSDLVLFVRWENPQFPAIESSQPIAIRTDVESSDLIAVGYEEESPEVRRDDQRLDQSSAERTASVSPGAPQWGPNR